MGKSIRYNGWAHGRVQVVKAALVNASSTEDSGLRLSVTPGRVGEASAVRCAAGAGNCNTMEVPAVRLDTLIARGRRPLHLLKLNVMGYEWEALSGASQSLKAGDVCSVLLE